MLREDSIFTGILKSFYQISIMFKRILTEENIKTIIMTIIQLTASKAFKQIEKKILNNLKLLKNLIYHNIFFFFFKVSKTP